MMREREECWQSGTSVASLEGPGDNGTIKQLHISPKRPGKKIKIKMNTSSQSAQRPHIPIVVSVHVFLCICHTMPVSPSCLPFLHSEAGRATPCPLTPAFNKPNRPVIRCDFVGICHLGPSVRTSGDWFVCFSKNLIFPLL